MKTYLVTGCAGFIGSNFVHYMLEKYQDIRLVNLDKLTYAGNLENLEDIKDDARHIFVKGDICDKALVTDLIAKYDPDYVINFAAESHVDRSIRNPEIFVESNVLGTVNLLQCCKDAWYDADAKTCFCHWDDLVSRGGFDGGLKSNALRGENRDVERMGGRARAERDEWIRFQLGKRDASSKQTGKGRNDKSRKMAMDVIKEIVYNTDL